MKLRYQRAICLLRLRLFRIDHPWMICDCAITHAEKAITSPFICSRCHVRDKEEDRT